MTTTGSAILYLSGTLPSRSETFVYREVLALRERGWTVHVASVHPSERNLGEPVLDALADEALQVYGRGTLAMLGRALREISRHPIRSVGTIARAKLDAVAGQMPLARRFKIVWQASAALSVAQEARRLDVSHVHAHMAHVPTTIAMSLARQLGTTFSFTGHAVDIFRERTLLKEKLERSAFCACISEWHRALYQEIASLPDDRLPIVRCGVNVDAFAPAAREERDDSCLHFLAIGRLVPKKGFDLLVEALAATRDQLPAWHCTIVGSGPEESRLRDLIRRHDLQSRIELAGAKSNREVQTLLRSADAFILPCRVDPSGDRDGIPVVLMEAMACAVPVIAGDLPAIRELVQHDETGLLVESESIEHLREHIERLATSADDRARLGAAGREHVGKEFSQHVNIARLEKSLVGAVGLRPSALGRRPLTAARAHGRSYCLISPCRNEAAFMKRTLDSVLAQSIPPTLWVIVDDGSTDETPAILAEYAAEHELIRVVKRENRGRRSVGPGVIEAFYTGYDTIDLEAFDYICKLDLDLDLPPRYFEILMERMEHNPRIATCSGKPYYPDEDGTLVSEKCGDETSIGASKFYRVEAFRDVGGFVREVMWDGIDCHTCRLNGWIACSWDEPDLRFIHLRPMGSSDKGILTGRMRHGYGQYFMGTGFVYMTASAVYRMTRPPFIVGGLGMWLGWVVSALRRRPRYGDAAFRRFVRRFQWACLLKGKHRAARDLNARQKQVWQERFGGDTADCAVMQSCNASRAVAIEETA